MDNDKLIEAAKLLQSYCKKHPSGSMSFVGKPAEEVLETVWRLWDNGKFHITIAWELMDEEGANDEN